LTWHKSFIT